MEVVEHLYVDLTVGRLESRAGLAAAAREVTNALWRPAKEATLS